jgi:cobalt-zinc-cadmium efflux system membrane fusion protein
VGSTGSFFTISELENMDVWADVFETDIRKIHQGDSVSIHVVALPDLKLRGAITKIQDIINDESRTMKVRISVNNRQLLLKPDMFTQINVPYKERERMPSVPNEALIFDNNKNYVLIYTPAKKVEVREVSVYRSNSQRAFISEGLKAGERVITTDILIIYNALYK